jgi:hypothetical protein
MRGDMPDPSAYDDPKIRAELRKAWKGVKKKGKNFISQLGSIQCTQRHPFVNVPDRRGLGKSHPPLLMIADVGGLDFFYDGKKTSEEWWSG